jgi:large subunit ribosomal protein L24
MFAYKVP